VIATRCADALFDSTCYRSSSRPRACSSRASIRLTLSGARQSLPFTPRSRAVHSDMSPQWMKGKRAGVGT